MLKITSWNVQGLRTPRKRMRVLRHLKMLKVDIALLQESHLAEKNFSRLKRLWVENVQGSLAKGKIGGVITLIHTHCPYKLQSIDADDMGCRITISLQP